VTLLTAVAGGALFATLTGKSLTALNSGTVLTVFVVIAVLHAARTLVRRAELSATTRLWAVPAVLLPSIGLYAAVYKGVGVVLGTLPMAEAPTALTPVHWGFLAVFLLAYVAVEMGWHRTSTRLYVTLLNTSQPVPTTLLHNREQYNAY
jgi:NAD(P)H-quinone oxidoreductase subunit 5